MTMQRMVLSPRWLLVSATVLALGAAVLLAPFGPGPLIIARITADTPDAQLELFAGSIQRGDIERARSLWIIPANASTPVRDSLEGRKHALMAELAGFAGRPYVIERVQWWGTCCMPHVIESPKGAGGARYWVRFDGSLVPYVVDVFAADTSWVQAGQPASDWAVRDVYRSTDRPLYFAWPEN